MNGPNVSSLQGPRRYSLTLGGEIHPRLDTALQKLVRKRLLMFGVGDTFAEDLYSYIVPAARTIFWIPSKRAGVFTLEPAETTCPLLNLYS
ncbi:hypothetical protein KGY79_08695 [Candidatus Bipolaricaulota bacterium]|nr:hypothetical protein [Candidatus Bipolaricaulota bacterium]